MTKKERKEKLNKTLLQTVKYKRAITEFEKWIKTQSNYVALVCNQGFFEPIIHFFELKGFQVEVFRPTENGNLSEKFEAEIYKGYKLVWSLDVATKTRKAATHKTIKQLFKIYNQQLKDDFRAAKGNNKD